MRVILCIMYIIIQLYYAPYTLYRVHTFTFISILAVSTRPPAGDLLRCALYCLGPAGLCLPYLSRFALEFSRPLRASVRSFISIRQVTPHDLDLDLDLA